MSLLQEYLKDLEEVVNVDCGSASTEGVTKVAKIMQRHYDEMGFHTELVDFGPEAGKGLFATNKPGAEHFDLMLSAPSALKATAFAVPAAATARRA